MATSAPPGSWSFAAESVPPEIRAGRGACSAPRSLLPGERLVEAVHQQAAEGVEGPVGVAGLAAGSPKLARFRQTGLLPGGGSRVVVVAAVVVVVTAAGVVVVAGAVVVEADTGEPGTLPSPAQAAGSVIAARQTAARRTAAARFGAPQY